MITFILPAHNEKYDPYISLGSLLCQTNRNWKAIVYHNGINNQLRDLIETLNDPRIQYYYTIEDSGFWGAKNRVDALSKVDTEYVINSSIQDYWLPHAVQTILNRNRNDIIYWQSINHLTGYQNILDSTLEIGNTDWGNFAVKTEIAKKVGINYPEEFTADGLFVKDLLNSDLVNTKEKINHILTIHN